MSSSSSSRSSWNSCLTMKMTTRLLLFCLLGSSSWTTMTSTTTTTTTITTADAFVLQSQTAQQRPRIRYHTNSLHHHHHHGDNLRRRLPILCRNSINDDEDTTISNNNNDDDDDSVEAIQRRLVQYGMEWNQSPVTSSSSSSSSSIMTRVPGCVASVYVRAVWDDDRGCINVMGNSDAILSRGILAVLCRYLQTTSLFTKPKDILDLDPESISDRLNLRAALSKGRNDGMANMLRIIQDQLVQGNEDDVTKKGTEAVSSANDDSENNNAPTVALLLSGGVDSSVALRLLQQQGYDVTAYYLKIWLEDEMAHLNECPWEDDMQMCHAVCDQAGVELQVISLQEEYHQRVMQHTLNEASMGRTPNPDILCNSRVKFGCFLEYLKKERNGDDDSEDEYRYDYIASGHYAQLDRRQSSSDHDDNGTVRLRRAPDPIKDQSYFLCALNQNQLSKLLFPIGHLEKTEVRQLANDFELPNRNRPDSQGLCFLGKVKFRDFLEIHLGKRPGDILDAFTGDIIGRHDGVWYHTVGQRKGIGKSLFPKATAHGPWYVVAKDPAKNVVYASNLYDEDVFSQARSEFHVENLHWIAGKPPSDMVAGEPFRLEMKIRHGPRLVTGSVTLQKNKDDEFGDDDDNGGGGGGGGGGLIRLDAKDGGLAPGQYVVFYKPDDDDAECLGGGIISERHWARFLLETESRRSMENQTVALS